MRKKDTEGWANDGAGEGVTSITEGLFEFETPKLRPSVIEGLLRNGEIMNIVGPPKIGKGCLACDLAVALATGSLWLEKFQCNKSRVLMLNTELWDATQQHRFHDILETRGISVDSLNSLGLKTFRGNQPDFDGLDEYLKNFRPGLVDVIIINAFYRFLKLGMREDDYRAMGQIYKMLEYHAERIGCSFVQVQFTPNDYQSGDPVDLASVCLSDTQLLLHPHRLKGVAVMEFATRTWEPIDSVCARFDYPLWKLEPALNPAEFEGLEPGRPKPRNSQKEQAKKSAKKAVRKG